MGFGSFRQGRLPECRRAGNPEAEHEAFAHDIVAARRGSGIFNPFDPEHRTAATQSA